MEIVLAVIAVLGTLAGVVVGHVADRGDERRRWFRDHCANTYSGYVHAFQQMRQILRRIATLDRSLPEWVEARAQRRSTWENYNDALVQIELFGTPKAYAAALRVDVLLRQLSADVTQRRFDVSEWHAARKPMDLEMRGCLDAIREELGLAKHADRSAWVQADPSLSETRLDT